MPSSDDPRLQETPAGRSSPPHVAPSESDDLTALPAEVVPAAPADQSDSQDTVAAETLVLSYADTAAFAGPPAAPQGTGLRRFGDYELIGELARGGMGVVYKARQVSLNRTVALKMILAGQLADDAAVQRFHTEAEAAAKLDHPGVVPIHEVGQHEGQHYFSMGFIEGQSLANKLADGPLPPEEAVELVKKLAEAMAYAHDHGVIHRDLKPANVLLDQQGQPRIADFGLAKELEGDSNLTGTGQILGTPSYMPPEQAAGKTDQIGPAADVYALGAVLYALLTGRPPFQAANTMDTLLQVLNKEPVSPRELNENLPRDLQTICLKCLEKETHKRYAAAEELAGELGCYLRGEPISARPISRPARAWRWCRRKPVVASLVATVAVVSISAFCLVTWQWHEAVAARADALLNYQTAERKRVEADRLASEKQVLLQTARNKQLEAERRERTATAARLAIQAEQIGDEYPVRRLLLATEAADINLRHGEPVLPAAHGILRFALSRVGGQPLAARVRLMKTSPSKRWLFIATEDGALGRWDLEAESPATTECLLAGHDAPVSMIDVSSDERWLVTGGEDRRVRLWNQATTPPTSTVLLDDHQLPLMNVGLTSDGRWVVASSSMSGVGDSSLRLHEIRLWRLDTRGAASSPVILAEASLNVPLHGWSWADKINYPPRHRKSVAISADGRWMVTGTPLRDESKTDEGTIYWTRVTLWDLHSNDVAASGRTLYNQQDRFDGVVGYEFSPDSRWLLTIVGAEARLWDLTAEGQTFAAHHRLTLDRSLEKSVSGSHNIFAKFLPDGQRLVMKSGQDVQLWDLRGEQPNFTALTNDADGGVYLSRDGSYVVTAGRELQKWVLGDGEGVATNEVLAKPAEPVEPSGVRSGTNARIAGGFRIRARSPDGSRIATDHTGAALAGIPEPPPGISATSLLVWDLARWRAKPQPVYYGPNVPVGGSELSQVAFLSSERIVAWTPRSNLVYFGDVRGKWFRLSHFQGHELRGPHIWAASPNERWLITADRIARLWDLQDRSPLTAHDFPGSCAEISLGPDDRRVATIGTRGIQSIWSIEKDQPLGTATELSALKFVSNELRQKSSATVRQRLDLDGNGHVDPEELLAYYANRRNARSTRRAATKPVSRLPRSELTYESSSYGRGDVGSSSYPRIILHRDWLAAGAVRGKLLVWDLRNLDPAAEAVLLDHAGPISSVSASDDGHWLVTFGPGSSDGPPAACLWELSHGESGTLEVKLRGEEDEVSSVAISPDGSRLVTGRVDKTARIWDLSASQPAKSFVELTGFEDKVSALTVGPRGRWLMTGGNNQPVRLWDLSADEVSAAVELGGTRCFDVAVSPDGRWAATAAAEEILLWNLTGAPPGSQQVVLRGCRGANSFFSRWKSFSAQCKTVFSANGRWLAAPGEENTARVWDLSARDPAASELVLRCHTGDFKQIAMSRDERWLAVAAASANVLLWDLTARHPQDSAAFVEVGASVIDFTPDSRWLITGNSSATTAWDLNMSALVEAAHQQAGRGLTDSERREYIFD